MAQSSQLQLTPIEASPIGVFDSGVGGLTVVRKLREEFPNQDIIYLGDTARVPYGSKSPRTVERYAKACWRFLQSKGAKLTLIACNTASANAMDALIAMSSTPVIGAVIPGATAAAKATQNKSIGVIGTLATVESKAYERAIYAIDNKAQVTTHACPLLVPLAEEGWLDGDIAESIVHRYLESLFVRAPSIDVLLLGCTHYPLLTTTIKKVAAALSHQHVHVVDSAAAMTEQAQHFLDTPNTTRRGKLEIYVTDATRIKSMAAQFLGEPVTHYEVIDLETQFA